MEIKNSTFWFGISIVALIVLYIFLFQGSKVNNLATGNIISNPETYKTQEVQVVKLSVKGSNYVLEPSTIKKNIPVRLEANIQEMPGCSKSISIPSINVRKNLNSQDNIIEFTPTKAGTFNIACSMNMYTGTFKVIDADGSSSNYVEKASNTGATCGVGSGCGCGA